MNVSRWISRPAESRTVRVTDTSLPSTGYSIRLRSPGASDDVYSTVSKPRTTLATDGRDSVVVRPFGTLHSSNRTTPGEAIDLMRIGYFVSLRKRMVWVSDTVASRP